MFPTTYEIKVPPINATPKPPNTASVASSEDAKTIVKTECPKVTCPEVSCPKVTCPQNDSGVVRTPTSILNYKQQYTNLGLLVNTTGGRIRYAQLFGRPTKQNNSRWQYYAKLNNKAGTQLPVLKDGKNCFSSGWPYCNMLYQNDRVSLPGEVESNWVVDDLYPVDCHWRGNSLNCRRSSL